MGIGLWDLDKIEKYGGINLKYTEKQLNNMASPISQSEEEKCKNAIKMIRDAMKELNYTDDEYILYYTYITNPKNKYSKLNPIQYGTCRLATSNPNNLVGVYWTSRQTIGDIELKRVKK